MRKLLLLGGILLSAALSWFAVGNYQSAGPIAKENLFGLAHSIHAAIENIVLQDPSLRSLSTFNTHDIAYFALIDKKGVYRFHSNPDLIGTSFQDKTTLQRLFSEDMADERVKLGTGEEAYELITHIHIPNEMLGLQIVLHSHRTDAVIRRAELNMVVLFSLLVAGWVLALTLYRYNRRDEQYKLAMAKRESLAQLGEMGAMLAHEIRNPLAGIKGYAQIIEKKPKDERNGSFAQRIVSEILRMETLVSDLLSYARSDQDAMTEVDVCEVIAHTAALLNHEAEQLHIAISTDSHEGVLIYGNRDRLGQVLLNLGKNAIQSLPDGGTIQIKAKGSDKRVIISVCDDGSGITQDALARIFEPFFTTKARGTGLGLALCKKIVEEHGGEISVQSVVGEGTTVLMEFPVQQKNRNRS
ncbi:MAG: ATP-binding protein [Desulfuromonadaceae bacterium]|nr:ATP-binding protein [Desulfuromonadaceae bacterium]